jgi:dTDP-4-dehydrorhamnose reductase
VFDGSKSDPYTEEDTPNPLNVYGRSKLQGERAVQQSGCRHLLLRTSWIYGARGNNFLRTMLRLGAERPQLRVVCD